MENGWGMVAVMMMVMMMMMMDAKGRIGCCWAVQWWHMVCAGRAAAAEHSSDSTVEATGERSAWNATAKQRGGIP